MKKFISLNNVEKNKLTQDALKEVKGGDITQLFCTACGAAVQAGATNCPECGGSVTGSGRRGYFLYGICE